MGEHNRMIESGYEQRVSVEKIVFHEKYENFQHDLGIRFEYHEEVFTKWHFIGFIIRSFQN